GFGVRKRLREIRKQRRGLRGDRLVRNVGRRVGNLVGRELCAGNRVVDRRQSRGGKVAASLRNGGNGGVKVVGIRGARARQREEDRIFAAGLGEMRNIRRAHERKGEPIRSIDRLRLRQADQRER